MAGSGCRGARRGKARACCLTAARTRCATNAPSGALRKSGVRGHRPCTAQAFCKSRARHRPCIAQDTALASRKRRACTAPCRNDLTAIGQLAPRTHRVSVLQAPRKRKGLRPWPLAVQHGLTAHVKTTRCAGGCHFWHSQPWGFLAACQRRSISVVSPTKETSAGPDM